MSMLYKGVHDDACGLVTGVTPALSFAVRSQLLKSSVIRYYDLPIRR